MARFLRKCYIGLVTFLAKGFSGIQLENTVKVLCLVYSRVLDLVYKKGSQTADGDYYTIILLVI